MKFEFLTRANAAALNTLCTGDKPEFASANAQRNNWLDAMFSKGLRGWIAFDNGKPAGYVEYLPIEEAPFPVVGENAAFLTCLWVLPTAEHLGVGGSLLAACVGDSPRGVATIAHRGQRKPAEFYEHFGFRRIDEHDGAILMLNGDPRVQLQRTFYRAHEDADRLRVDVLFNPECPWSTRTAERVISLVKDHPAHDQIDLWVGNAWECGAHMGLQGGIFFNGVRPFATPPSDEDISMAIERALTARVPSDL